MGSPTLLLGPSLYQWAVHMSQKKQRDDDELLKLFEAPNKELKRVGKEWISYFSYGKNMLKMLVFFSFFSNNISEDCSQS